MGPSSALSTAKSSPPKHYLITAITFVIFIFIGFSSKIIWFDKLKDLRTNEAAWDDFYFHMPQINYFLANGFNNGYHSFVAMIPGMHLLYAGLAFLFGVSHLDYQNNLIFALHSFWVVLYISCALYIAYRLSEINSVRPIVFIVPLLCSSYPVYSWIWPTTDLPMTVLFFAISFIEIRITKSKELKIIHYSILSAVGVLVRQSFIFIAFVPLTVLIVNLIQYRKNPQVYLPMQALISFLPICVSLPILIYFVVIWNGVVPPGFERHTGSISEAGVVLAHVLAFSGVLGAPYTICLMRLLRWKTLTLLGLFLVALVAAIASTTYLPLDPNPVDGRYGSIIWTIEAKLPGEHIRHFFMFAVIALGTWIWISAWCVCYREGRTDAVLLAFGLYTLTLMLQKFNFQRYLEIPVILTLTVFVGLHGSLSRWEQRILLVWYGFYALVSLAKLYTGFGSLGPSSI